MAGRYPFDPTGGRHPQFNAAQMRAAFGLPHPLDELYLQRHLQEQQQRDLQLRQLLLQEHLDQQHLQVQAAQEQQLRAAIGEQLQDFPDLQQRYQNALINEQLQRRQAELRYREELRLQQMSFRPEDAAQPANVNPVAAVVQQHVASSTNVPMVARFVNARPVEPIQQAATQGQNIEMERKVASLEPEAVTLKRAPSDFDQKAKAKRPRGATPPASSPILIDVDDNNDFALDKIATAADLVTPQMIRKGTVDGLVAAAADKEKLDEAAGIMMLFPKVEWPQSDDEESDDDELGGLSIPSEPAESIDLPTFKSAFPCLPREPVLGVKEKAGVESLVKEGVDDTKEATEKEKTEKKDDASTVTHTLDAGADSKPAKVSIVLEYPFPIDTWWPSVTGIRRERRNNGETSDEDNFEESEHPPLAEPRFRANERKIRNRLSKSVEPGVLEKLPHCRIHRVRTKRKKNSTAPELVYCWQVTELYPNDIMVNCSRCGTWRHALCGGHYKPYSIRANTQEPFVAVCEFCHQEDEIMAEHALGAKRLERQRMEHLRRSQATSAVMRHSSFSKHTGTYKWPLGSVSATHIGGHTRSVHGRHDKAEKQWADMSTRLGRGFGYRPKDRLRSRTKELERLLISIEDAEGYTDRHNMMLFLLRDTYKGPPVGFEKPQRNIFDPADDQLAWHGSGALQEEAKPLAEGDDQNLEIDTSRCARPGCTLKRRFDSMFCSDGCGVVGLELDLLKTLHEASEIHPSTLRL